MTWGGVIKHKKIIIFSVLIIVVAILSIVVINNVTNKSYATATYLYDKVETDATTNGYGGTYSGDHADSVKPSGAKIEGDKDIYYYSTSGHGIVKFADFCWQIIRTTDTGGVKLVYAGVYSSNSKCDLPSFNEGTGTNQTKSISSTYQYGTAYTFNSSTGEYTLSGIIASYGYSDSDKINQYSCLSSATTCKTLYLINSKISSSSWNVTVYKSLSTKVIGDSQFYNNAGGATGVGLKYKTTNSNDTNSKILSYLYDWYEDNLLSYNDYLDDTVFCNDRTGTTDGSSAATGSTWVGDSDYTGAFYWHNYDKTYSDLSCDNAKDRFTTNNIKAKLDYPIGLISQPEYLLGGGDTSSNIHNIGAVYFLVSPAMKSVDTVPYVREVNSSGKLANGAASSTLSVRPSIALNDAVAYGGGQGTLSNPYIVEAATSVVKYSAGVGGTLVGNSQEEVSSGGHPTGRDVTTSNGYSFVGWIANIDVKLSNNTTITKGTTMTKAQTQSIVINSPIKLTAKYIAENLYSMVETDIEVNGYGDKYVGEHSDTYDGTVGNHNIYYYNEGYDYYGAGVSGHNVVVFAGYCWDIVRTTDTGDVKVMYAGQYDSSKKCSLYYTSMYNGFNPWDSGGLSESPGFIGSFAEVYAQNFYARYLLDYSKYIVDTVYCNDRTLSTGVWSKSAVSGVYYRGAEATDLTCPDVKDRLSVNNSMARLTYPIALITAPEARLMNTLTTFNTGSTADNYITLSPLWKESSSSGSNWAGMTLGVEVNTSSTEPGLLSRPLNSSYYPYYRFVITLSGLMDVKSGTGTTTDPYLVDDENERSLRVNYKSDSTGTISGSKSESVNYNGHPVGRDVSSSSLRGWVCSKDVVLSNGITIPAGTLMTKAQTQSIVVTSDITLTAKYTNVLYNQLESDVSDDYAGTYSGEHSDTYDGTVGNRYIYYPIVGFNNVKIGDYCWQIIRTTDTGGVKLLYNGEYNETYKCKNYVDKKVNYFSSYRYYSTNFEYNYSTKEFKLVNPVSRDALDSNVSGYYTCNSTSSSGTCDTLYYIKLTNTNYQLVRSYHTHPSIGLQPYSSSNSSLRDVGYKYKVTNDNDTDSRIKTYIDGWYSDKMSDYTDYFEDTVFCNDRTGGTSTSSSNSDYYLTGTTWRGEGTSRFYFHNYNSDYTKLSCDNVKDRFSINNTSAQLTYPVGLMTAPEYMLGSVFDQHNKYNYWLLSPQYFNTSYKAVISAASNSLSGNGLTSSTNSVYVKPVVSLKPNAKFTSGDGSADAPYTVEAINTATFYYQSSSTSGTTNISSVTTSCTPSNGSCSAEIPSAVRNSVGTYNNSYAGLNTSTGSMSTPVGSSATTVTLTSDTTYYAVYRSSVTNYYYSN